MAPNAGWDTEVVTIELQGLIDLDFEVTLTGFSVAESDVILDASRDADAKRQPGPEDEILPVAEHPVGRVDDLWFLGRRRLLCGDARSPEDHARALNGSKADHAPIATPACGASAG